MARTPVSAKILEEAQKQAEKILSEAAEQVRQIQEQGQKESEGLNRQIQAEVEQASEQEQNRILAGARQGVTVQMLQAKHEMIEKVFSAAQEALGKMPADQYRQLLKDLLKQAVLSGNETVITAEGEKHLDQALVDEVNAQLASGGSLQLSGEKIAGAGGFVLAEGKAQTRVTWEVLLSQARRELEPELCKVLFAAGN